MMKKISIKFVATGFAVVLASRLAVAEENEHSTHADSEHAGHRHPTALVPRGPVGPGSVPGADVAREQLALPELTEGVTDLKFSEIFKPIGPVGLEYSEKSKSLQGKRVRMLGYMIRQEHPVDGMFLLSPVPVQTHEAEMGLADDLPATVVHVLIPGKGRSIVPYRPGLLLISGILRLRPREEADGRVSTVRLEFIESSDGKLSPSTSYKRCAAEKSVTPTTADTTSAQ